MKSTSFAHLGSNSILIRAASIVALSVLMAAPGAWSQSNTSEPAQACIAIMTPSLEGIPGSAADAGKSVSDLIASYIQGPSIKAIVLEAKVASLAADEAKQKGCEAMLVTSVHRKSPSRGFMKALAQGANSASWSIPYGSSVGTGMARTGAAAGLQTLSSMAQSTKAKDELTLEYRLQSTDGRVQFGPKSEHRTAKVDGEDLLTPVVAKMAEAIAAQKPGSARGE